MQVKTHWKKFYNYEYVGTYSLPNGADLVLTIKSAKKEMVQGQSGKKEECFVLRFSDHEKGMILNRTNAKTIEEIYQTPFVEEWTGKKIQLYKATGIRAFGSVTDGLRIRPAIPRNASKKDTLFDSVKAAFRVYDGEDKEAIGAMIAEKKKSNDLTETFLNNTLKTLTNAA